MTANVCFLGLDSVEWTAISAIATVIYSVAFLLSLVFISRQVSHMRTSTMATAFCKALDILQTEERRADRRAIFALEKTALSDWTEDQRQTAERVIHSWDEVGTMIRHGMFGRELIVDGWGNSLRRAKTILMPLVQEYRTQRDSPEIWDDFEWLCEQAEEWQREHRQKLVA
jgi:hypothetical protein